MGRVHGLCTWVVSARVCVHLHGLHGLGHRHRIAWPPRAQRRRKLADLMVLSDSTILNYRQGAQIFISESGLYSLIMRSNKPEAKLFQRWVTKDVLPSIRKTGQYTAPPQEPEN